MHHRVYNRRGIRKTAVNKHNYIDVSLARLFYILLIIIICISIYDPNVLSSESFKTCVKDPVILIVALLTNIGMLAYYWLLASGDLNMVSLIWPIIMLLTIVASCLFIGERVNTWQWIGIAMATIGLTMTFLMNKQ